MRQLIHVSAWVCLILSVSTVNRAQKPELFVQTGHADRVNSVAFSPDGKTLASGSSDYTVKLWDVSTGAELRSLKGHSDLVLSVAFSPDGKTLASGSDDQTVKLWDVSTGAELRSVTGDYWDFKSVTFSPDGKILAIGGNGVKLLDISTGAELRSLKGHPGYVHSVAFSPDGQTLATGGDAVKLWEVSTGAELRTLNASTVTSVAFSHDGKTLAIGSFEVKLWDVATGVEVLELRPLKQHASLVFSVAFSPDGKTLISGGGSDDPTVRLWDVSTGTELRTLEGHSDLVNSVAVSPDGKTLASGSWDQTVKLWDVSTGTERTLKDHSYGINSVAFSSDGRTLACGSARTLKLWDVSTGGLLRTLKGHSGSVNSVAFNPDGKTLASGSDDNTVKLWNVSTGAELRTLNASTVTSVAFSHDGKILANGNGDEGDTTVVLWNVLTGSELRTLERHSDRVTSVAFSPVGRTLASGSWDYTVKLWNVSTGGQLRTLKGHSNLINSVAFSPDGKTLASGSNDHTVKLWNVSTGTRLRTLEGHSDHVLSVAFSPDGKTLASGSLDKTIKLWDVSTGRELRTLKGHSYNVSSLVFSSNNKYLLSGSGDATTKVWEVSSGTELASLIALDEHDWIVVTPDGLFDGSPAAWHQLIWRFNNNTFDDAPVEAYYYEFFRPGLLTDIFAGKRPKAPSDIDQKDRRQPQLKLTIADAQPTTALTARNVTVKLDLSQAPAGAQDLRLFRNGSLVKIWPGDLLKGTESMTMEAVVPIVAGENQFTAYAFNHDNIKSADATLTVMGADSLKRDSTLYVLAIGVGQYENPQYTLTYTADDARGFGAEVQRRQEQVKAYQRVEVIPLLDQQAKKEGIIAALKKLGEMAEPEDGVIIYFSGHGTAQGDRFYLIPHDIGYRGSRRNVDAAGLQTILTHSISDLELETVFRSIDAGRLLLVVDACNSGKALQADDWRRGPMNTKGLGQLAYEKGMYVLTASQDAELAYESAALKHSYLTYALVEEGLKSKITEADADHDKQVLLREWFDFATQEVPRLRTAKVEQKARQQNKGLREVALKESERVQQPRVFYRREADPKPFVIARP